MQSFKLCILFLCLAACSDVQPLSDDVVTPRDSSADADASVLQDDSEPDTSDAAQDVAPDVTPTVDATMDEMPGMDASTDSGTSQGASCAHSTSAGVYGHMACSESYQCCDGDWKMRGTGCGTCTCVEPTGASGCGVVVNPGALPYVGISLAGSEIPRSGLTNATGSVGVEQHGDVVTVDGRTWVRGTISHFGGPNDTGVTASETGAITGENLRALNNPLNPSASQLASNPEAYYYLAMRWSYSPGNRSFWKDARIILRNPETGDMVVVRPVDWGPHTRTGRIVDVSPQTEIDLNVLTDDAVDVAFAPNGTPLGPVVQ